MADRKFSELTSAGALAGTEIVAVSSGGSSVRTTTQDIANLAPVSTTLVFNDTGGDHTVTIVSAENNTANRNLEINLGDATRRVTVSGDVTLIAGTMANLTTAQTLDNKTLSTLKTSVQTLSGPGAVNVTTGATRLTTTGADAFTLADGAEGQMKFIVMMGDGGDGTLTPSNLGAATTITFNDVGDSVLLMFLNTDWWVVSNNGCTVA
jgi:hypothetical protein